MLVSKNNLPIISIVSIVSMDCIFICNTTDKCAHAKFNFGASRLIFFINIGASFLIEIIFRTIAVGKQSLAQF